MLLCALMGTAYGAVKYKDLPPYLQQLGMQLFKDQESFESVLKLIDSPMKLKVLGTPVIVATLIPDKNSRERARREFDDKKARKKNKKAGPGSLVDVSKSTGYMIDIGANFGIVSMYSALTNKQLKIISVEPAPTTFFIFCYNMYLNKIPHLHMSDILDGKSNVGGIVPLNRVVATTDAKEVEFTYYLSDSQLSGLSDQPESKDVRKVMVKSLNILNVLNKIDALMEPITYMKIDCEGCEFDILPSIKNYFLDKRKVLRIGGEFHVSLMQQQNGTFARGYTKAQIDAAVAIMNARKCPLDWSFQC